jgi:hypothetical protein
MLLLRDLLNMHSTFREFSALLVSAERVMGARRLASTLCFGDGINASFCFQVEKITAIIRSGILACFSLAFIYVAWSAYNEIRLIRLLRSPASEKEDSRIYEGHTFKTRGDMEIFIAEQQRDRFSPWTVLLEEWLALLILAASASFLGSVARYVRDSLDKRRRAVAGHCLIGLVIGPCLMCVAWVSELLILEGELRFRPETMAAVCFLGGIFVQESWNYVAVRVRKLFAE